MKLNVIFLDTNRTRVALIHENQMIPYGRRHVQIELTPEQIKQLQRQQVGQSGEGIVYEELGDVWLEDVSGGGEVGGVSALAYKRAVAIGKWLADKNGIHPGEQSTIAMAEVLEGVA
jgi:hypothetical protein